MREATELPWSEVDLDAKLLEPKLRRQLQRVDPQLVGQKRDHHVDRRARNLGRKHAALGHHDDDPLQAQGEATRGNVAAEKHPDEIVVAAAAPETAGQILPADFHDRARVV